ncbi:discoidin domain-containing protein [Labedaea rhizosphaerae]|uniref:Pectate lyase-like protein n=1 Tax=Labedaea rhizosphaerae TaxID=598644 RepID=A0A4R6S5I4_LABRH|nr:discoidin domain-containing protein [Labedaea rhizosphaerae]TDP94016.1 pectate lyase-like protein [Labedaea rhizosphaerae]
MSKQQTRRRLALGAAAAVAAGTVTVSVLGIGAVSEAAPVTPAPTGAASPFAVAGRGATVDFTEYEAESAATNGAVLAMDRTEGTLAGEASGRRAVRLDGQGKYVEFTLTGAANAIDVRASLPDSGAGTGTDGTLSVYVDGTKAATLALTSRYSWYYGYYPFTNNPGDGHAHHFYDETRALLGTAAHAGSKVRVQVDGGDTTSSTVDLADFYNLGAPASQPAGSLSVTDYGATANDSTDDAAAFDATIAAAKSQGKEVWVPRGRFVVNRHLTVDRVTIRGAGNWYSELRGTRVGVFGLGEPSSCGQGGNTGVSSAVKLYDFAIIGEVRERVDCDQVNGIGGALGGGSVVSGLWIQHTKVGLWLDGPFDGLTVTHNTIVDQTADGLNLHQGISHVTVDDNFLRNTGDDGLAMWSEHQPDHDNTFSNNTVVAPILANNIAIYGGQDNSVTGNVVSETQTQGGGIHVANRFTATPLAGTTTVSGNTTIRAGVLDPNWQFGVGALWFDARDGTMTGTVNVSDMDLIDSNYEAIQFIDSSVSNIHFDGVRIQGAGTFALQLQATGGATFKNVVATGIGVAGTYNCMGAGAFAITDQGGNSGWSSQYCGPWPNPVYGGDNGGTTTTPPPTTTTTTTPPANGNLALHRPATASGQADVYGPGNAVDGNANSYWESTNNAFPQWLTVDLGAPVSVGKVVLKLPPSSAWGARTQTLSVLGSTDGGSFATLSGSHGYTFDPASGNTATVTFAAATVRYLRVQITANTGWPAGQLSELEAYSS